MGLGRKKVDVEGADSAKDPDQVGRYPSAVHVPALESRRYLWTARAYAIALYLSLVVNFALAGALFMVLPLKEVQPMLVTFYPQSNQVVKIEPFEAETPGFAVMTEKMIREYVQFREEILNDNKVMQERYNEYISRRTTQGEYRNFVETGRARFEEFRARRFTRYVDVTAVTPQGKTNTFVVEYETVDKDYMDNEVERTTWLATISISFVPQEVTYKDRFLNPLGFTVTSYSTRQKRQ